MDHCIRHYEEPYVAHCRVCNRPFCNRCLVFAFGADKPPYCVGCALTASGVRNNSKTVTVMVESSPTVDRRIERAQRRADRAQEKATQKAMKRAAKNGMLPPGSEPPPRTSNVPVPKGLPTPSSRFARVAKDEHAVN